MITRYWVWILWMSRCATDPGYNFRGCVKASVVTRLGCRPEWDPEPAEVPLCTTVQQIR